VKSSSPYSYAVESASFLSFTKGTTVATHTTAPGLERGAYLASVLHTDYQTAPHQTLQQIPPAQLKPQNPKVM